jgi:diaminohydroxyphosphoribosylaminopyrimidine deaminase/5-amino-6-(5-phosphoribosylamino)uracil reductase
VQGNQPLRIVIDRQNRLPDNLYVKDGSVSTIIYTEELRNTHKYNVEYVNIDFSFNLWQQIYNDLYEREIQSVIIEGGAQILEDCIQNNLWDEMRVFIGPISFKKGVLAPNIESLQPQNTEIVGNSVLHVFFNQKI